MYVYIFFYTLATKIIFQILTFLPLQKPANLSRANEGSSKYFRTAKSESFAMKENVPSVLETMGMLV